MKNVKRQRDLWLFVLFPVVGFTFGLLATYVHWAISFLVFPWAMVVENQTSRMRCPHCLQPVGKRQSRVFSLKITWWSPLTPARCVHCGRKLAVVETDHAASSNAPPSQGL